VHHAGVTVIYSEAGETADQVIQQLVRSGGKEIAVVSSDHEILSVAKSHGAFTIRSDEFAHRLLRPSRSGLSALGSRVSPRDEEDGPVRPQKEKKGNPRKLPKKVRQRNRLMRGF
ncbi:MAG: NYN domain-containing protein, partial [Nitrospira sp.]|nr:NYN domain-containing protein [Nitrospira sp.]